jgi:hypothetical protein
MGNKWIRFEDGKSRSLPQHASILKDGRLIVNNQIAKEFGLLPGKFAEIFHNPEVAALALRVIDSPSPYSLRISSTVKGGIDTFDERSARGSYPSAVVGLRGFLNSRRIGLASKVKGYMYKDGELIVFEFAEPPQVISPTTHVRAQLGNAATAEKIAGDLAQ